VGWYGHDFFQLFHAPGMFSFFYRDALMYFFSVKHAFFGSLNTREFCFGGARVLETFLVVL